MAEDPIKKAQARKIANEAMASEIGLTKQLGTLLQSNLKAQGKLNEAVQDRAKILQRINSEEKENLDLDSKIANAQQDIANSQAKIAKSNAGDKRIKKEIHQTTLASSKARLLQLNVEKKIKDVTESIKSALSVSAIIGASVAMAKKFGETLDTIGQQFGSLNVLGKDITGNLLNSQIEATRLGGNIQDVASITNTLASNFGMSLEDASKLSGKVFDTSKAIGLSADESANLFGTLTQTANLSAEQAESLAEGAFQLARQNGVAPSAVLRDIAGSAETVALFTKDGGDNIAEAAIQARKLGLSLDTTAKITEGLLDFESSITKEVEASVLIGKQLNFQKARELALGNDIAGATKAVVDQLGSEAEFNNLNLIQRKALADSIGVSVTEMSKLVGQGDKLSLSGAMASGNFEDLLGEEGISQISKLAGQFATLGVTLTNSLGPVLMAVTSSLNLFLSPLTSIVGALHEMNALAPIVGTTMAAMAAKSAIGIGVNLKLFTSGFLTSIAALGPLAIPLAGAALGGAIGLMGRAKNVNDFKSGPGGITHMSGPAGSFSLNPRDSVLATTNPIPVNDMRTGPAGSMGGNSNVSVSVGGRISGRDIVFFQEQGAEFGDAPGNGLM